MTLGARLAGSARVKWILALAAASVACDQSTLTEPPDAADLIEACVPHATPFCDASPSGCIGSDGTDPNAALLPTDAAFPVGCTANVTGSTRDLVTGYCSLTATCACEDDDAGDAGGPRWVCTP